MRIRFLITGAENESHDKHTQVFALRTNIFFFLQSSLGFLRVCVEIDSEASFPINLHQISVLVALTILAGNVNLGNVSLFFSVIMRIRCASPPFEPLEIYVVKMMCFFRPLEMLDVVLKNKKHAGFSCSKTNEMSALTEMKMSNKLALFPSGRLDSI